MTFEILIQCVQQFVEICAFINKLQDNVLLIQTHQKVPVVFDTHLPVQIDVQDASHRIHKVPKKIIFEA